MHPSQVQRLTDRDFEIPFTELSALTGEQQAPPPAPPDSHPEVASLFKKQNLDSKLCVKIFAYSSSAKGTL